MDFEKAVHLRKSVRNFKNKKPSWKSVLEAIDLTAQGPYADNNNHLKFLIIEEEETIQDLAKLCEQNWIKNVKLLVMILTDDTVLENLYGERGRIYSRQQAGAAIQTLLLALTNSGLSSCWVGSYDDEAIKRKLKIPKNIQIEAIIPIGYEQGKSKKPAKKSLDRSLNWEEWGKTKRPAMFDEDVTDHGRPLK